MTQGRDLAVEAFEADVLADADAVDRSRLRKGGEFALADLEMEAVWGRGDEVAWPAGEPLLVVGPTGIGHTTLIQRLILCRLGLRLPKLLGHPVGVDERPILYIAADRPRQARRSLRRMVGEDDRDVLDERLMVWEGPPEFDVARAPERLADWATSLGAGTVVIDALKDVTARLSEDETGSGIVRAWNHLVAAGVEVVAAHHQRKATGENRKPNTLDDVYGSAWITAGAGSVILLWGRAGDPIVELSQLKQASGEVGPAKVSIDFPTGELEVLEGTDPLSLLRQTPQGVSAQDAASVLYGSTERGAVVRARRQLDRLVDRGWAHRQEGQTLKGQGARKAPDRYHLARGTPEAHGVS
jgi:replicative DNA helicase